MKQAVRQKDHYFTVLMIGIVGLVVLFILRAPDIRGYLLSTIAAVEFIIFMMVFYIKSKGLTLKQSTGVFFYGSFFIWFCYPRAYFRVEHAGIIDTVLILVMLAIFIMHCVNKGKRKWLMVILGFFICLTYIGFYVQIV